MVEFHMKESFLEVKPRRHSEIYIKFIKGVNKFKCNMQYAKTVKLYVVIYIYIYICTENPPSPHPPPEEFPSV